MPDMQNTNEQARHQQDLECLALLQQAQQMRMETIYLDNMFAVLKGNKSCLHGQESLTGPAGLDEPNELDELDELGKPDYGDDSPDVR